MFIKRREAVLDPVDPAHTYWSPTGCIRLFPFTVKNCNCLGHFSVNSIIKSLTTILYCSLCSIPLAFGVPVCSNIAILLLILIQNYLY